MNVIKFDNQQCRKIRSYLDSYLNSELLVETNHEVLKHIEECRDCARVLDDRGRVKTLLKQAVQHDVAPAALRARIEQNIRRHQPAAWWTASSIRWAMAMAAMIVLAIGSWAVIQAVKLRHTPSPFEQSARVLEIGLKDHINCTVVHKQADRRFTPEQMTERLGAEFSGLVPVVKEQAPAGYEIVVAHKCHVDKREFVHLILRNQDKVLSLILTHKNGEAFPSDDALAVAQAAGMPLYEARLQDYEMVGFETKDYLGFVVSNLGREEIQLIATRLAPAVRDFLAPKEA
jgi:anti-sigma factor (TIGR02949 family)